MPSTGTRYGAGGMVCSVSPLAAVAGVDVLLRGGNAFDAAVAVAAVEGLTIPSACGLGGDVFAVLYDARRDQVLAINGSGVVARGASRDYYVSRGYAKMPLTGIHSVSVPGAPHAYATLNREFGTRPLAELLAPAIRYAEEGMPVSDRFSRSLAGAARKLSACPEAAAIYAPGGTAPRPGERFVNRDLAATLRTFAEGGAEAFYRGEIAREIVRASQQLGGLLGLEEFAAHTTEVYTPLHVTYRGVDVYETRPPSQGLLVLEMLNLLEGYDLTRWGFGSAEALHVLVEAKKLAFADRLRYCGDPRFVDNPLDELLSKTFAARRRAALSLDRAGDEITAALPETLHGDTSYFAVADGQGNAISFIHSLSAGFGSGVVAGRTGILLNNRAGRGFTLEAGHPNVIEGGKRTMHTLNCYLLCRDGRPWIVGGTPGGDMQPQWNVQMITNLTDFSMTIQQAVEAPRWYSYPGTDPEHVDNPFELRLESRYRLDVEEALARRGHRLRRLEPWGGGGAAQLIELRPNGVLVGATDPRPGGVALGF